MNHAQRAILATLLLLAVAGPAQAYIDPSSGSMILQGIIAGIAAILVTAKLWWHRLLVMLGIRKRSNRAASHDAGKDGK
jgi:hypothetical protein